jgi:hypothetical protein
MNRVKLLLAGSPTDVGGLGRVSAPKNATPSRQHGGILAAAMFLKYR